MKKILITGCAGFIGSNLTDRLLNCGYSVRGIDNLSTGQLKFLDSAFNNANFEFLECDLLNPDALKNALSGIDFVFHMAANADVRFGTDHPGKDLEQNTIATFNLLEAMRANGISKIAFASTGSVYGEAKVIPTPEDAPFPLQTSLYGASKVACEGLISCYCEGFNFQSWIFRFVSILGERYTHGHIFDFYQKLKQSPDSLEVLGNGTQKKSYLYIQDCLDAMLTAIDKSSDKVNIFNLGVDDYCEIKDSIKWICNELNLTPVIDYGNGDRGWIGDNPFIFLQTSKIRSLGWSPQLTINQGVIRTVDFLRNNEWVFETRK
jgi:UDP-glucose 4-epimerase